MYELSCAPEKEKRKKRRKKRKKREREKKRKKKRAREREGEKRLKNTLTSFFQRRLASPSAPPKKEPIKLRDTPSVRRD